MKSRIIGGAAAVIALLGIGVTAQAGTSDTTVPANSVNTFSVQDYTTKSGPGGLGGWDIKDNTLGWSKFGADFRNNIGKTITAANTATQAASSATEQAGLAKADASKALGVANTAKEIAEKNVDVKGDAQFVRPVEPRVITNLGGKYFGDTTSTDDDRYTKLGETVVPAGSWMVYTTVQFTRVADGVAGSRPQVGLRIGQDQTKDGDAKWGVSVGTIGGNDIAPYKGADLFGSTSEPLVTTENTTVEIFGFGYNDNRGTAGSGEIAAAVKVTLVRA